MEGVTALWLVLIVPIPISMQAVLAVANPSFRPFVRVSTCGL